jgi:hypothetical protein
MKRIAMIIAIVSVSLTSGMGQSVQRTQRSNIETSSREDVYPVFIVDREETRWTELGLVHTLYGHLEEPCRIKNSAGKDDHDQDETFFAVPADLDSILVSRSRWRLRNVSKKESSNTTLFALLGKTLSAR